MKDRQYFLIDFDSTFIKSEGLEELAAISLKNNPNKNRILAKIKDLTAKGMEGKIPFDKSLKERIKLLQANKNHVSKVTKLLKKHISSSVLRNKRFFKKYSDSIYIISGGFKEYILPIVEPFSIKKEHVFANTFEFDKNGNITGIDKTNFLAKNDGKIKLLKSLNLKGNITIIGDGYTDYKLKAAGLADKFIAFTENIERETVVKNADHVVSSFDEFLYVNKFPSSLSYPKNRIKVLLLENIDSDAIAILKKEGYTVEHYKKSFSEDELIEKLKDISVLGIRSRTVLSQKVLQKAPRLIAIGAFVIGTDKIDLTTATKEGVAVFNAPYGSTRSVVELVIAELMVLTRKIFERSNTLSQGTWDKSVNEAHEIKGKTLGIIGYGTIGTQVGLLAESLGMKVYFYDIVEKAILGNAQKCKNLKELLKKSDIITIHVDGRAENKNLISEKEFRLMKDNVIFLNASRGFVVDIGSLVAFIKNGKVRGAAIDVFPKEPKENGEPFKSPLQQFPNVILTPHIGASTVEAQKNIAKFVSEKIIDFTNTGSTHLSVNMPNVQLSAQKATHRLLHMHKNRSGILAQINQIFADNNINILRQYLKTNEDIGYVITDVNKKYDKKILDYLRNVPDTIKFRVLY